jgi:hypothetical protein
VKARIATSVVLAVGILLGTSACNLFVPQSTTVAYDPGDGVGADMGDLSIRNAILFVGENQGANLVLTVVNTSADDARLKIEMKSATPPASTTVQIPGDPTAHIPGGETKIFGADTAAPISFGGVDFQAGSLVPVYFQYGSVEGKELLVPVLDTSMQEYQGLAPTPTPTPVVTPTVKPTPLPTETPAP